MKWIMKKMILLYKKMPFYSHLSCKFTPTCSEYALIALERYNIFKASYLIIKRILRCNPFSKGGYDPVP